MKKKLTLKQKKVMYKGVYDPKSESKYAVKKRQQAHGHYSKRSPFGR